MNEFLKLTLSSLLATCSALCLFYIKLYYDRRQEKKNKKTEADATIEYLCCMLNEIVLCVEQQLKIYDEYITSLKRAPHADHLLIVVVNGNLERLVKNFEHSTLFHAYILKFGNDQKQIVNFHTMIGALEFMYSTNNKAIDFTKQFREYFKQQKNDYFKFGYEGVQQEAITLRSRIENDVKEYQNSSVYKVLNNTLEPYLKNASTAVSMQYIQEHLVMPLYLEISANHRSENDLVLLRQNSERATYIYNDMILQTEGAIKHFKMFNKAFVTSVKALREAMDAMK
ncbi:MAG TPA: hypothetical protein VHA56_04405 [Mucilaginibacter sp.]|nr:hypothetical protein [Mucilaginibacter sp.]